MSAVGLILWILWLSLIKVTKTLEDSDRVPIKIVEELSNIDLSSNNRHGEYDQKVKVHLLPSAFSGPEYLKKLAGSCYSYLNEKYKFKFCPFDNVTQEEIQSLLEPYKGVLGVWGEWIIENNTFAYLHFIEGNRCGSGMKRNIKIKLECGYSDRFMAVREPEKCSYEGTFESPLFCGLNALTVYPRLPEALQHEWDILETERHHNILTSKGYQKRLQALFLKAGFLLSDEQKRNLNLQTDEETNNCEKLLEELQVKVQYLEEELELKNKKLEELLTLSEG